MSPIILARRNRRATTLIGLALIAAPAVSACEAGDAAVPDPAAVTAAGLSVEAGTPMSFVVDPTAGVVRAEQTVTVTNTGSRALVLRPARVHAVVRHESTASFAVLRDCPGQLAPRATCELRLAYFSADPGSHRGELVLSDVRGAMANVNLVGAARRGTRS